MPMPGQWDWSRGKVVEFVLLCLSYVIFCLDCCNDAVLHIFLQVKAKSLDRYLNARMKAFMAEREAFESKQKIEKSAAAESYAECYAIACGPNLPYSCYCRSCAKSVGAAKSKPKYLDASLPYRLKFAAKQRNSEPKWPRPHDFLLKSLPVVKRSPLVLPTWKVRRIARRGGLVEEVDGYLCKKGSEKHTWGRSRLIRLRKMRVDWPWEGQG